MRRLSLFVAAVALAACDGFKEAMTAHVDVVARAGGQELSVSRLAELMGRSKVPLRPDVAEAVANLWVNYQLLGVAAANGDSLTDPKLIDDAMWAPLANARAQRFYETIARSWATADSGSESTYNQGDLLAAKHILFQVPQGAAAPQRDSVRRVAEGVRGQVTSANFGQLAARYGSDGTRSRGGSLGVFPKGAMVPEFERAVGALRPGDIAPGLVETQFGYHIIQRTPYAEARAEYSQAHAGRSQQVAESTYLAKLEAAANVQIKSGAGRTAKAVATDMEEHRTDRAVLASWKGGELTAGRLARWIEAFPPQAGVVQQLRSAPDSVIESQFVRQIVRNELVLRQADSAKVQLDSGEVTQIRAGWRNMITMAYLNLGVEPRLMFDSTQSKAAREGAAAQKVEGYMDQLLSERARYVEIPAPLAAALREKYKAEVNKAGIDRALQSASKIRAQFDSTAAANRPRSEVPLPGAPGQQGQQQQGRPPQPAPQPQPPPTGTPPRP
ncbi:MAG TPA: peptidylprolyl isomerase [Gemmatimonadaceae bacterium]|nr:peptidylprolyl isomerase [Gemmatimonadaceae bacterium]